MKITNDYKISKKVKFMNIITYIMLNNTVK